MKKTFFLQILALLALLSACDLNIDSPDNPKDVDPTAVGFNVYMNRGLQSKAGWGGVMTLDDLKDGTKANGFGVFAYYGNGALYNETSKPDFMYDQQVTYNTTNNVWGYSPVKYWPNEFGEAASSEAADRLTFFAYAPFADVTPSTGVVTGDATTGIIGMSRNISAGDPVVMYGSSLTPGAGVDLCWGVAADAFTSSVDGDNNSVAAGYPFLNVIKPKTGDHLKFEFNHALAQLNVQIDADIDEVAADGKTKIYVRSVTFNGFSMRGSLNLNSNTTDGPIWYDISGTGKLKREPVTVYDGRTDGMEGVATASDVSEKPANLNPVIVQDKPYDDEGLKAGVTTTAVNLFNGAADAPVMVIPTPGVPVSVTIVYDVETEDSRLAGLLSDGVTHGSSVENKITKNITTTQGNMILSAGKKYVVKLHLGLTSVKFDAIVANWDDTTYPDPVDVNLPDNAGTTPPTPTGASFRGYDVSKGILKKDTQGYSITDGTNQLEVIDYFGNNDNLGVYYHQWSQLQNDFGDDGNGGIYPTIASLNGWSIPTAAEFNTIIFGGASNITVNGDSVNYGYALVEVSGNQCILLIPDETDIICASLNSQYVGPDPDDIREERRFSDLSLSTDEYIQLTELGCVFFPCTGQYWPNDVSANKWRFGPSDTSFRNGLYWLATYVDDGDDHYSEFVFNDDYDWCESDAYITKDTDKDTYYPVRLVKKIN